MSTFNVPVVLVKGAVKHPNADSLSIVEVEGCPVIFKTDDFLPGDIAIYLPVDSVVPSGVPGLDFLGSSRRVKARRLRGIFSMGLLLPAIPYLGEERAMELYLINGNAAPVLGITKYEEPEPVFMQTEQAPAPPLKAQAPVYDMESYRKYKHLLVPGEKVVVTEKIHGTNSRFVMCGSQLHVGSRTVWKKYNPDNLWWKVAEKNMLGYRLADHPGMVLYGETYGQVQDLKYGAGVNEHRLVIFDVFNSNTGEWLDYDAMRAWVHKIGLPTAPELFYGEYTPAIEQLADGDSVISIDTNTLKHVPQIREGFVVRPLKERWNAETSRTIFKMLGEAYLTRKGGTELH